LPRGSCTATRLSSVAPQYNCRPEYGRPRDRASGIAQSDPDSGPTRIVCPTAPANRWVFPVAEIQVDE